MKSVIICDMEGLITNLNDGAIQMFGYDSNELVDIKRVSIFSPGEIVLQNVPIRDHIFLVYEMCCTSKKNSSRISII